MADTSSEGFKLLRRDLHVPFEEKDEAKALGARWDASARRWYVPAVLSDAAFSRWFEPRPEVKPVAPDFSDRELSLLIAKPSIVHATVECWSCHRVTPVLSVAGVDQDGDLESVTGILRFDKVLAEALAPYSHYRLAYSRTTKSWAFANVCVHCEALQGDFHLHMEPDGPFFALHARDGGLNVVALPGSVRVATDDEPYGDLD